MSRASLLLASFIIVGLAAVNLTLSDTAIDTSPITMPVRKTDALETTSAGNSISSNSGMSDFTQTFERPLFSPTRRKPVPVVVKPEPATPVVAQAPAPVMVKQSSAIPALLGLSASKKGWKALLRPDGKKEIAWYGNGETIDGWMISAIDRDHVALSRGGQIELVTLYPAIGDNRAAGIGDLGAAR